MDVRVTEAAATSLDADAIARYRHDGYVVVCQIRTGDHVTGRTSDVSQMTVVVVEVVQGIGLGFLFLPLSTVTL
jgi:hypothetical protein